MTLNLTHYAIISFKSLEFRKSAVYNPSMDINTVDYSEELTALPKLTPRQSEILDLITKAIDESGLPPTRAEIATQLGFASANAAEEHLRALAKKGYIELTPGTSRGIRIPQRFNQTQHANKYRQLSLPSGALQQLTLPLIGRVAAGSPIMAVEHIEKQVPIDPSLFSKGADYLLKVKGMSMRDAGILDGDYLAVRKLKKAKWTETALKGLQREAAKANMTLQEVMVMCCERNWVGFKAEWAKTEDKSKELPLGTDQQIAHAYKVECGGDPTQSRFNSYFEMRKFILDQRDKRKAA